MPALPVLTRGRWWVCLDTETTGLPSDPEAGVVEVAAALVNPDGTPVATFSSLVQHEADNPMRGDAEAVHGITRRAARFGPAADEVREQLLQTLNGWVRAVRASPVERGLLHMDGVGFGTDYLPLYAWNRSFDQTMMERSALTSSWWGWGECLQLWATPHLYDRGLPSPDRDDDWRWQRARLQDAAAWLQLSSMGRAHRALSDVLTTVAVVAAVQTAGGCPGDPTWSPPCR